MTEGRNNEVQTRAAGDNLQASMDSVQSHGGVNELAAQTLRDMNNMDGESFRTMINQTLNKEGAGGYNGTGMDIGELKLDKDGNITEISFSDPFTRDRAHDRTTIKKGEDKPQSTKLSDTCVWAVEGSTSGVLDATAASRLILQSTACAGLEKGRSDRARINNM